MDTGRLLALVLLVVSSLILVLVSAAEASVSAITRSRARHGQPGHDGSLNTLLDNYIRQRQRVLRSLSVAVTVSTVITALAITVLIVDGDEFTGWRMVIAALASVLVVGFLRQTARTFALINPENTGLRLARPILAVQAVCSPLAWAGSTPAAAIARAVGRDPDVPEANPADELLSVLERTDNASGRALSEERRMMRGILAMSEQTVREVMTPRPDIQALAHDAAAGDVMRIINETGFSRVPIYEESMDHIVGVVYAKDLLAYLRAGRLNQTLREIARPPYFVPETKHVDELLADMRRDKVHMAVAVDEYGGTAGIVTVEDLLEEIVGEIADEYDVEDVDVQQLSEDEAIVDARLSIDDLNELFGTEIDSEDFDTVGGLILSLLGRLAVPGDEVTSEEYELQLRVLSILGRRIKKVRVTRLATESAPA
ncbi:MAG: hemolysin family protein [Dehalococcoidia bacterium]|nr:hemolysin family protein [Dehalococcoidia bacterium]HRC62378.1 hemolysin family protein [Dehalococcoidia bacterium]